MKRWTTAIVAAAKDASDPLHAWAKACMDDPKPLSESLRPLVEAMRKADADAVPKGAQVVIDYANSRPEDWMPDGPAFGCDPVRPGAIDAIGDPAHPTIRFAVDAAAKCDRTWDGMKLTAGTQNESGALGRMVRSGRTIRTPTFTINPGKVFYRVRGAGMAYAAVDSHMMIAGPLHGDLIANIKGSDSLHWAVIDLTPYKGRRAHLEFTAAEGSDFAVACVLQASAPPTAAKTVNHALLSLLSSDEGVSPERLAVGYQQLFLDATKRLTTDQIVGTPDAADCAQLANWLLRHQELLTDEAAAKACQETVASSLDAQKKLAAHIRRESRLTIAMQDGDGIDECVFKRGSYKTLGDVVPRRFLEALAGPRGLPVAHGSGRLELARQITNPTIDPFLPRVMVNRIWHHLFGRGIVASVDNFGVMGEAPTHPQLLDYLAAKFVKDGWSIKKTIRALVLSNTYRMSSKPTEADKDDPQNLLLHRMRLRRLEGEAIRDAMLSASGRLDLKMYGPSVPVHLTPFLDGSRPTGRRSARRRRPPQSVYRRSPQFLVADDAGVRHAQPILDRRPAHRLERACRGADSDERSLCASTGGALGEASYQSRRFRQGSDNADV